MPYSIPISLAPSGHLQMHLPAEGGGTRTVDLRPGFEVSTLTRVLMAGPGPIDSPGVPTRALAKHWQYHEEWPDEHCPFCRTEGKTFKQNGPRYREAGQGVQVRHLKPRSKELDLDKLDLEGI